MAEKSRWQIHMDLSRAKDQANKLDEAARSIRAESKRFESCRSNVKQAWEGDNATQFTLKMGQVSEDLNKIARQLEKSAATIRANAKRIYDAEMEAKRLADIRNR